MANHERLDKMTVEGLKAAVNRKINSAKKRLHTAVNAELAHVMISICAELDDLCLTDNESGEGDDDDDEDEDDNDDEDEDDNDDDDEGVRLAGRRGGKTVPGYNHREHGGSEHGEAMQGQAYDPTEIAPTPGRGWEDNETEADGRGGHRNPQDINYDALEMAIPPPNNFKTASPSTNESTEPRQPGRRGSVVHTRYGANGEMTVEEKTPKTIKKAGQPGFNYKTNPMVGNSDWEGKNPTSSKIKVPKRKKGGTNASASPDKSSKKPSFERTAEEMRGFGDGKLHNTCEP